MTFMRLFTIIPICLIFNRKGRTKIITLPMGSLSIGGMLSGTVRRIKVIRLIKMPVSGKIVLMARKSIRSKKNHRRRRNLLGRRKAGRRRSPRKR